MAVYKTAQLGEGWAVFRIEGTAFEIAGGPYATADEAHAHKLRLEGRTRAAVVSSPGVGPEPPRSQGVEE